MYAAIIFSVLTPAPLKPPPTAPAPDTAAEPVKTTASMIWFAVAVTFKSPPAFMLLSSM